MIASQNIAASGPSDVARSGAAGRTEKQIASSNPVLRALIRGAAAGFTSSAPESRFDLPDLNFSHLFRSKTESF